MYFFVPNFLSFIMTGIPYYIAISLVSANILKSFTSRDCLLIQFI